jgi:hypothetical protein
MYFYVAKGVELFVGSTKSPMCVDTLLVNGVQIALTEEQQAQVFEAFKNVKENK